MASADLTNTVAIMDAVIKLCREMRKVLRRPTGPTDVSVFDEAPEPPPALEDAIVIDSSSDEDQDEDQYDDQGEDDDFSSAYHSGSENRSPSPVSVHFASGPPSPSAPIEDPEQYDGPASPEPEGSLYELDPVSPAPATCDEQYDGPASPDPEEELYEQYEGDSGSEYCPHYSDVSD